MHPCSHYPRAFLALIPSACIIALLFGLSGLAEAQITYTPTLHNQYQAVNSSGTSAWPSSGSPYSIAMIGVVINNPGDMLYYSDDPVSPYYSASPQWQVYIQAANEAKAYTGFEGDDFGGTALYMRRFTPWGSPPTDLFPADAWAAEMERLNYPLYDLTGTQVTDPLQRGDLILVQARAPGMFYNGKYNINTKHTNLESNEFYVTILQRGLTIDVPTITLAHLKNPDDSFIFDETRATGCEHYQASLVHLDNLLLDDDPTNWALNNTVTVRQGNLTFSMQLGIDPSLALIDATALVTNPFSITAILNQEDPGSVDGYVGAYRLWLTSVGDLTTIPEPGTAMLAVLGFGLVLGTLRRRSIRGAGR